MYLVKLLDSKIEELNIKQNYQARIEEIHNKILDSTKEEEKFNISDKEGKYSYI